jgi:gamma-glutamyl-gamma-aminobutyrate hydrolase PuuD
MVATVTSLRVGIYGSEETDQLGWRGCSLWPTGYAAAIRTAGAEPVLLTSATSRRSGADLLEDVHGIVWTGNVGAGGRRIPDGARLCEWCRRRGLPVLAVDQGMIALNLALGGTVHTDLSKERPEALQHRHPPEPGLRHAIEVIAGTRLAAIYGEGELVVNSEHRQGICRVARGFQIGARALDGVIEAIEAESESWFALGVQWRPASQTASGLDIQVFRGLVQACEHRLYRGQKRRRAACVSAA